MNRLAFLLAMIAGALHGPAIGQAQAWPQKPVRVLVGLAPGGNPDTLARMLAAKWGDALGQQFVVENRPGAGSTIAADLAAKSAPDGYTVLISDSSVITTAPHLYKSLPYDPFRDLQAVSLAVVVPMWLVVHPSVPANSVAELVALAKSRKDPMPTPLRATAPSTTSRWSCSRPKPEPISPTCPSRARASRFRR